MENLSLDGQLKIQRSLWD